jgi:HEAT repeat protein
MTEIAGGTNPDLASVAIRYLGTRQTVESFQFFIDTYQREGQSIQVRLSSVEALGNFDNPEVLDFLEDLAEDSSHEQLLRQSAIRALGVIGKTQSLGLFRRLLDSDDPFLRTTILQSLGAFEPREISGIYRSALRDSFWRVRLSVLQALARSPIDDLLPMVIFIARNDPEVPVRTQAYRTLRAYNIEQAWEVLEADAFNTRVSESYRLLLLEMVVQERFNQNKDRLIEIIDQEWAKENSRLLDVIGRNLSTQNQPQAIPLFERFLGHRALVIKIYGIRGLGNSGGTDFRERLEALADDTNPPVIRQNARAALEKL